MWCATNFSKSKNVRVWSSRYLHLNTEVSVFIVFVCVMKSDKELSHILNTFISNFDQFCLISCFYRWKNFSCNLYTYLIWKGVFEIITSIFDFFHFNIPQFIIRFRKAGSNEINMRNKSYNYIKLSMKKMVVHMQRHNTYIKMHYIL